MDPTVLGSFVLGPSLGLSELIIGPGLGLVIVAVGTSLPEVAALIASALIRFDNSVMIAVAFACLVMLSAGHSKARREGCYYSATMRQIRASGNLAHPKTAGSPERRDWSDAERR